IEPMMQVLSNYLQHLVLSEDESYLLRSWLMESGANEDLFDEISNEAKWFQDCPVDISHDLAGSLGRIRMQIIKNLEL
ncbi:MAG TPA: hypothetical protein VFC34_01540, partial [Puia sp.]|nr:hypothetical protein [Puia sp.]